MAHYLIESTHSPDQCLQTLDELLAQGADILARYDFGCAVGDHSNHVCYTTVEAESEQSARKTLPGLHAPSARITETGKFTAEQIRSFH